MATAYWRADGAVGKAAAVAFALLLSNAAQGDDWKFYRHDLLGTANAGETLTAAQGAALEVRRTFRSTGNNYSNPIVADGSLYYTAGDGFLHVVDLATFTERWSKRLSITDTFHCIGTTRLGPVGAPAVVGRTVFVPGADGVVYALETATGNVVWSTKIADPVNLGEFLWSSAFPLKGKIYVGVAAIHDCLLAAGRLVALDQATGQVAGTWWADAKHGTGGGIWTQQAYDERTNRLFATTGTIAEGLRPAQQPWADAFVAIDPDKMETLDSFAPVPGDNFSADMDFGSSPTLYDAPDGRHFIAATDKNGWVYALDRDNLAKGVVWQYQISGPGASPDLGESSIVSAPYADGTLFVGGGRTADGKFPGAVAAVDAFTGKEKWLFHPDGFVLAGMTVTGQVLFAATTDPTTGTGILYALDQATGAVLTTLSAEEMFGEPTWANGALYVGDATGAMFELVPNPVGPQPDFDLVAAPLAGHTAAGGAATYDVKVVPKNGFNDTVTLSATQLPTGASPTFTPAVVGPTASGTQLPYHSTLALSASPSAGALFEVVNVSGTGGGRTRRAGAWLVVSDFSLSCTEANGAQGANATSTIKMAARNGFNDPVTLSASGLPPGTTASFNPATTTGSSTLTFSISSTTPQGTYAVQVSGNSATLTRTCTVSLAVSAPADFQISVQALKSQVAAGEEASYSVTVAPAAGFTGTVTLSASGLPSAASASFRPGATADVQLLTISVDRGAAPGAWTFSVLATGGGLTRSASASLAVLAPPDVGVVERSSSGCSSNGPAGLDAALLGLFLLGRAIRARSRAPRWRAGR